MTSSIWRWRSNTRSTTPHPPTRCVTLVWASVLVEQALLYWLCFHLPFEVTILMLWRHLELVHLYLLSSLVCCALQHLAKALSFRRCFIWLHAHKVKWDAAAKFRLLRTVVQQLFFLYYFLAQLKVWMRRSWCISSCDVMREPAGLRCRQAADFAGVQKWAGSLPLCHVFLPSSEVERSSPRRGPSSGRGSVFSWISFSSIKLNPSHFLSLPHKEW